MSPGIGIGIGLPFGRGGPPAILNDGNTVAWFDFIQNITKDGSDFVSVWGDKSGNGNDLLQAIGTNQPLWSSDGVLFDGVDNFMKCVPFVLIQPEFIYIVIKQVSWGNGKRIMDGNVLNTAAIYQSNTTPNINVYAGASIGDNSNLAVGSYGIIRLLLNGASSELIVDETTPVTGDAGSEDMGGLTLGASGSAGSFSNIEVKEIIIRKIADGATDEAAIYSYLKSKYGL